MKPESLKILVGEINYKLGRIDFFNKELKEWKKQKDDLYGRAQRRLAKLIDETLNLLQIMNLEEHEKFKEEWESTFEKLQKEELVEKKTN
ncbi:MAG: hypothetical protein ABR53_04335 [Nitrosopumilus sp. BACL13 MAG-121220-bin23]|jgi:hypothetical protein|nr:MAG: hypothetical protein ABR53_04335 [Nitrosopumilus sp. BACL13 MAG-121220-bin23]